MYIKNKTICDAELLLVILRQLTPPFGNDMSLDFCNARKDYALKLAKGIVEDLSTPNSNQYVGPVIDCNGRIVTPSPSSQGESTNRE